MSEDPRDGWAARRADRCHDSETGHPTWGNMWVCCPSGMSFSLDEDNNTKCTTGKSLAEFPTQCADPTLILYSDPYGYFCCASGLIGFVNKDAYKGCATLDDFNEGRSEGTMKGATQRGQPNVSDASATNSTATSAAPSTFSQSSIPTTTSELSSNSASSESSVSQASSTNTGAIAGGVVGGVCGALLIVGLIWFFCRRRRASQPDNTDTSFNQSALGSEPKGASISPGDHGYTSTELYDDPTQPELQGSTQPRHELPGHNSGAKQQSPFELY